MKQILIFLAVFKYVSVYTQPAADRLYLHLDKEVYTAGETIWFRAYIHDDSLNVQGTSLHVELVNDSGKITLKKIFPILNGLSFGQMELSPGLAQQMYCLRAYTPEMLQSGEKQFFQPLPVVSRSVTSAFLAAQPGRDINVEVRPLCGPVVAGFSNQFVYTAVNEYLQPVPLVKGEVRDASGNTVASFPAQYPGAGSFAVLPFAGETYTAAFTFANGLTRELALPAAAAEGFTMQLRDAAGGKKIMIAKTNGTPADGMALNGFINGKRVFQQPITFSEDYAALVVPYLEGHNSPVDLELTSGGRTWCSTRILNNKNPAAGLVQIVPGQLNTSPKAANQVKLVYNDTVEASLSVSITDAAYEIKQFTQPSISTALSAGRLLNAELTGEYPVDKNCHELLLNSARYQPPLRTGTGMEKHSYIYFNGLATDPENGKPVKNETITCMVREKDRQPGIYAFETDPAGYFRAEGLFFYDSVALAFYTNIKGEQRTVKGGFAGGDAFTNSPQPGYKVSLPLLVTKGWQFINAPAQNALTLAPSGMQDYKAGDMVTVTAKRRRDKTQEVADRYRSGLLQVRDGNIFSRLRYTFDLINDPPPASRQYLVQFLQSAIPNISVNNFGANPGIYLRGASSNATVFSAGTAPAPLPIYLNEMPVDLTMIQGILTEDVALVQFYNSRLGGSAIAIYTRKAGDYTPDNPKAPRLIYAGYNTASFPDLPDYDSEADLKALADKRSMLYWNPVVEMGAETRELPIKFYNNDQGKTFKIVVQGMTADGRYIYHEQYLKP